MHRILISSICFSLLLPACGDDSLRAVPPEQLVNSGGGPNSEDPWDPKNPPPGNQDPSDTCQTGALMGRLCLPGQDDGLVGARVYLYATDCLGTQSLFETVSESNGQFSLAGVPAGTHTLFVEHASLNRSLQVNVLPGEIRIVETTDPNDPLCLATAPPRLALITGEYDSVDVVLDSLDLTYNTYSTSSYGAGSSDALLFLSDFDAMAAYDVIFFNCGSLERDFLFSTVDWGTGAGTETISFDYDAITYQNLRKFTLHGGDVYASDWAWPIAEGLNADVIDFYGDETNGVEVLRGQMSSLSGQISDNPLSLFLGTNSVPIDYDLPGWAVINGVSSQANVYVRGDITATEYNPADPYASNTVNLYGKPLLVGFRPFIGGGYVIYTTFHYHAQPNQQMIDVLRFLIFQL